MNTLRAGVAIALVFVLALAFSACDDSTTFTPASSPPPPPPPCPQYDDFLHTIAIARPAGSSLGAAVTGTTLISASGADGLLLFDIANPADVQSLAAPPGIADARDVAVSGSLIFVADGSHGLVVVDASAPAAAHVVGTVAMPGHAVDVDVDGTHAYVANDVVGLVVVDVSTPSAPAIDGIENTPGKVVGVAVDGPLAFVADMTDGLRIVNVLDPAAPFIVKTVAIPGTAIGVATDSTLVAVAARQGGLRIVDASVPTTATLVGRLTTSHDALAVAMGNRVAYVAEGSVGLDVVDISNPLNPILIQSVGTPAFVRDVALTGGRLAVAEDNAGARALAVERPTTPTGDTGVAGFNAVAVVPFGDLAVVADASSGLRVVDPIADAVIGSVTLPGKPVDVFVADSLAYVALSGGGTPIVDLHNPTSPVLKSSVATPGNVTTVAVQGDFIYTLSGGTELSERRIDGTGTTRLYSAGGYSPSFTLAEPTIYMPDRAGFIYFVDRGSMRGFFVLPMDGSAERVVIHREDGPYGPGTVVHAYVAISGVQNGQASIDCWDVTTPAAATLVSRTYCGGDAADVATSGNWLIVPEGADGLELFALDAPAARPVGFVTGNALRVCVAADRMVVALGTGGVRFAPLDGCLP